MIRYMYHNNQILLTVNKCIFFLLIPIHYQCVPQNKPLPTWNQALSQVAHFEGESDSGLESERRASNLLHVGETQSYP